MQLFQNISVMQTKLQELTEKIYSEGVEKAQKEAEAILKAANEKARAIEEAAQAKASAIVAEAEGKAGTLKQHVDSELKMTVSQSVAALKQNLAEAITMKAIQPAARQLFTDVAFLQSIVEKVVKGWASTQTMDLKVTLSEKDRKEMETFFKNQLAAEMNKGLELSFSDGVKSGFKIGPADGSYMISFTDQDFTNFFKAYLRPKTSELLFGENK